MFVNVATKSVQHAMPPYKVDNFVILIMAIDVYGDMHHLNTLNVLNVSNNDWKGNLKV